MHTPFATPPVRARHALSRRPPVPPALPRGSRRVAGLVAAVLAAIAIAVAPAPARAAKLFFFDTGVSPEGTPLRVQATIATGTDAWGPANSLRITLVSDGAPTRYAVDVLSSFSFNIVDPLDGSRPTLTYLSGTGAAYEVHAGPANDKPISWTPQTWTPGSTAPSNLVATRSFDEGWQFKMFTPPPAYPFLGYGIGTVGNSDIDDVLPGANTTFDGRVVSGTAPRSMINLGIYSVGGGTDIDPAGVLDGARLVRGTASFAFLADRSLANVTSKWVPKGVAFGFGTAPELVLLPEPGTLPMAATAAVAGLALLSRRRRRRS